MDIKDDKGKVIATVVAADPNISGCDEGVWLTLQADDGTRPTVCWIKDKPNGSFGGAWYLGVYRDVNKPSVACDLAVTFSATDGPSLQVVKGKDVWVANIYDLLKKIS